MNAGPTLKPAKGHIQPAPRSVAPSPCERRSNPTPANREGTCECGFRPCRDILRILEAPVAYAGGASIRMNPAYRSRPLR